MEFVEDRETTISTSDTATTARTSLGTSTAITSPTPSGSTASNYPHTRSSSRVKASKDKANGKEISADGASGGKGNLDQGRSLRSRRKKPETGIVINEPQSDPKGKKRAPPDPDSSEEQSPPVPLKRARKQPKTTRPKSENKMPRKGRSSLKGKGTATPKPIASTSDDVEMLDATYASDGEACELSDTENKDASLEVEPRGDDNSTDDGNEGGDGNQINGESGEGIKSEEEAQNVYSLLGGDFTQLGAFLSNINSRLKSLLASIKQRSDPTARMLALQELSELLSVSNEETLHSFSVDAFVAELVKVMGGSGKVVDDDDSDRDSSDEQEPKDPDAALAAALAASEEGLSEEIPEAQLLACRCLANLMEAIPGSAHTVVYHGAVPVLCSKLVNIVDIDLAEQTLSTMEKISEECPSSIVRENGLSALLNMLDFFPTGVQRIALQAAANCCRSFPTENFGLASPVFPILRTMLGSSDQRLVEYSALCVIRLIESFQRSNPDHLVTLLDADFLRAIGALLLPLSGSSLISNSTYTLFLSALASAAKASAKTALSLLQADILRILYQLLTGVLPPNTETRDNDVVGSDPISTEMGVMENLAHRSKEQVEEALALVSELMPPLPKDGVFDNKAYTEKGFAKMAKAKSKAEKVGVVTRAQASAASSSALQEVEASNLAAASAVQEMLEASSAGASPAQGSTGTPAKSEPNVARLELLQSHSDCVDHFLTLMIPVLVDVYSASVLSTVRVRALTGILKAISFAEPATLQQALKPVAIASFTASILITADHHPLTIGALQLIELLLMKCPSVYRPEFAREGVLHAIEGLASRKMVHSKMKSTDTSAADSSTEPPPKRSSSSVDPQDAITIRARVIRFKYMSGQSDTDEDPVTSKLRVLASSLGNLASDEEGFKASVEEFARLLSGATRDISSFEIRQSGMVEALLSLLNNRDYEVPLLRRRELFVDALIGTPGLSTLVKRLQEMLTRTENFEVRTVSAGHEDNKHRSASMLARAMRLKLVADESSDIPRSVANMTVSIQAIATFQALNDYLRPRLSGLVPTLGASAARLSAMLAMAESRASALLGSSSAVAHRQSSSSLALSTQSSQREEGNSKAGSLVRRRSQRLSAKKSVEAPSNHQEPPPTETTASDQETHEMESLLAAEVVEGDDDDDLPEKTVNVAVTADGTDVEAKTPHGTRVATPNRVATPSATPSGSRVSYAAALKSRPTDWHLQFSIDSYDIPLDATIYGAIYQHEVRKASGQSIHPSSIWSGVYTVKFKKVEGPPPPRDVKLPLSISNSEMTPLSSLPENNLSSQILRLLRVLSEMNAEVTENGRPRFKESTLPDSAFFNNKLTAKLVRQLEETMIVASSCLPDWALDLPQHYPLLFPFATRFSFLQSTSFGYARLILKWQSQQQRSTETSRRDDGFGYLGRLQRQKVRISRKYLLESAVKVFELYGSSSSVLEVEYFEEVGTGLGPTLEFYSLVSKELARRDLKLWHEGDSTTSGPYVNHPHGLFPAPLSPSVNLEEEETAKKIQLFQMLGQFAAKALLDSRIIDIAFNPIFLKLAVGKEVPITIQTLRAVDPTLARSLSQVQDCKLAGSGSSIDDLSLDFTIPGYDIALRPNSNETAVTADNVDDYVSETLDVILKTGIRAQVQAFRQGFSKVFSISDMAMFSVDELGMLFGNAEEDWSPETLNEAMKADHGFTMDSPSVRDLISIMNGFDQTARRRFLQFITGSPRLPIGGFRGLNPPLTVVRKPHEPPLTPDDYLPSVMTCVNYLKLPRYSSVEVMKEKLRLAVDEGIHSGFHLS